MRILKSFCFCVLLINCSLAYSQTENCLHFDGQNDHLYVGDENDIGLSDFTIEAWVYIDYPNTAGQKIINKGLTTVGFPSNAGYGLRACRNSQDKLEFQVGGANGQITTLIHYGLNANQWHHVAGVRASHKLILYLDGELVEEENTPDIYNINTNIPLAIGAIHKANLSPVNEFFNGKIDEVRIWNTARSQAEINLYKDCAISEPTANLIAVYNLNESVGLIAADSSATQIDGTLVNGPSWDASTVALNCIPNAIKEIENSNPIYPNPFTSALHIPSTFVNANFKLYSISGKLIRSGIAHNQAISFDDLTPGVYTLVLNKQEHIKRVKIFKQ